MRVQFVFIGLVTMAATAGAATLPRFHTIEGVPHVLQKPDLCGEACVSMALRAAGRDVSQDEVLARSGLTPADGRGCWTRDLYRALANLGVPTPSPWTALEGDAAARSAQLEACWIALKGELARGVPVIVCMLSDAGPQATEHFRLLVGYDDRDGTVLYHEPAVAGGGYRRMPVRLLLSLWPLGDGRGGRMLVRFLLPPAVAATDGALSRKAEAVRRKLGNGFAVQLEPPFIVASNLDPAELARVRSGTIRWAFERLSRDYFDAVPFREPLVVYLFRDAETYQSYALKLFGEAPETPYGYYSSRHQALVMNIATGGGTLVHEMTHPMLENDFPGVPAWFNEGLASLFEQCAEREGRITGLLNWRLAGLRQALAKGRLGTLDALLKTTRAGFYGARSGENYAQARYLMYWVQEQGLLHAFYRRFRDGRDGDPTGRAALEAVLGDRTIGDIDRQWRAFVASLES